MSDHSSSIAKHLLLKVQKDNAEKQLALPETISLIIDYGVSMYNMGKNVLFFAFSDKTRQSTHHRVNVMAEELGKKGHNIEILYGRDYKIFGRQFNAPKLSNYISAFMHINEYDVIYIHKTSNTLTYLLALWWKKCGKRVIYDIDDAVYLYNNALYSKTIDLFRNVDYISTGSHFILNFAKKYNPNAVYLPAPANEVFLKYCNPENDHRQKDNDITIGWLGDGRVHVENLKIIVKPMGIIANRYPGIKLKFVSALGNRELMSLFKDIPDLVCDFGSESWMPIEKIPYFISDFDISIMPLTDHEWSKGKCAQKIIDSMATGIPVVASNIGENAYVIQHGENGYLADNCEDWVNYLSFLIENKSIRCKIGENGKITAQKKYSTEICGNILEKMLH